MAHSSKVGVVGGRVCQSFIKKYSNGSKYFCKQLNNNDKNNGVFDCEVKSLSLLDSIGIRVPKFVSLESNQSDQILTLEFIDFELDKEKFYPNLASILAKLHNTLNHDHNFGMTYTTFLGCFAFPKPETHIKDWITFFKDYRWKPLFDEFLSKEPERLSEWIIGMKVYDKMLDLFKQNHPNDIVASLLHGDMNPGNWGVDKSSRDVILFDCSCYFGHNWYDIAALVCWKKLPQTFVQKYNSSMKHQRIPLDLNNPIIQLYQAFIYLSGYFHENNQNLLNKTVKICKKILLPFSKIYPSLTPILLDSSNVLLVQCGSFNPIHRNHIRNLILASNSLPSSKSASCVLIPAPDSRIKQKSGPGLNLSSRVRLITQMLKTSSYIISIGIDLSQLFGSDLIQHLKKSYPTTEIVMVCGSDTYSYNRKFIPSNIRFIVVQRNNDETVLLSQTKMKDVLIENQGEMTMSSTFIRHNPTDPIVEQMITLV